MLYVVCYDIEEDGRRQRLSSLLGGFGERVQKSVFECRLDDSGFRRLLEVLEKRFQPQTGENIRIYPLCRYCQKGALGVGERVEREEEVAFIEI